MAIRKLDENIKVKYNEGDELFLIDVISICQPGDIIEGVPVECFIPLLKRLQLSRSKNYSFSTDRRYGKWRFILFGERQTQEKDG